MIKQFHIFIIIILMVGSIIGLTLGLTVLNLLSTPQIQTYPDDCMEYQDYRDLRDSGRD